MSQENIVKESSSAVVADSSAIDLIVRLSGELSGWARLDDQKRGAILIITDGDNTAGGSIGCLRVLAGAMASHLKEDARLREILTVACKAYIDALASEEVKRQSGMTGDAPSDGSKENDKDIT